MNPRTLLIHVCCAPCAGYVCELFAPTHEITLYFYNPNISPPSEYAARLAEVERFATAAGHPLLTGGYDAREWTERVREYRFFGEGSYRCEVCFRTRLQGAFKMAVESGISAVTTTLSISPHKDAGMINRIGLDLQEEYGVRFVEGDFKKNGGYRKSVALSREYGFYRQNYCGCVYSRLERKRDSSWPGTAVQSTQTTPS